MHNTNTHTLPPPLCRRPPLGSAGVPDARDALANTRALGRVFDALDFAAVGQVEWRDVVTALALFVGVGDKSDKLCVRAPRVNTGALTPFQAWRAN